MEHPIPGVCGSSMLTVGSCIMYKCSHITTKGTVSGCLSLSRDQPWVIDEPKCFWKYTKYLTKTLSTIDHVDTLASCPSIWRPRAPPVRSACPSKLGNTTCVWECMRPGGDSYRISGYTCVLACKIWPLFKNFAMLWGKSTHFYDEIKKY